jgi:predicted nucleic acid-binding protein
MIMLDTYVMSEPLKPAPDAAVVAWLDAQAIDTLFNSAISVAELRFGIASMPSAAESDTISRCTHPNGRMPA